MILALIILVVLLVVSTIVFIFLNTKNVKRLKMIINDVINQNIRKGYYVEKVDLLTEPNLDKNDSKNFDPYQMYVYITEIDRYTNGQSKIKLDKIEVISGFKPTQYEYVKQTIKDRFCSLRDTSDINWIESENSIKEQRKEKLSKIVGKNKILNKILNKK